MQLWVQCRAHMELMQTLTLAGSEHAAENRCQEQKMLMNLYAVHTCVCEPKTLFKRLQIEMRISFHNLVPPLFSFLLLPTVAKIIQPDADQIQAECACAGSGRNCFFLSESQCGCQGSICGPVLILQSITIGSLRPLPHISSFAFQGYPFLNQLN